ncbi:hypothetical protein SAMN05216325_1595 [Nitrosomonas marina]|uniref:Uncharacterized protein n=2 Tax=Nitrosomonas marina TaxID=917 RepID=A0A1H8J8T0_9PROT|nr:hypothetical protein SAMN05216325_1595 [Nitrosomonas marina]
MTDESKPCQHQTININGPCQLDDVFELLKGHELLLEQIMTKLDELGTKLNQVLAQIQKAKTEITDQVSALQTALQDAEIPQEAEDALNALAAVAQQLDDMNPDAPADGN